MTQQYLRRVSLTIGTPGANAIDLSDFHIKFSVRKRG